MLAEITQDPFAETTTLAIYRHADHPRELLAIEYDAIANTVRVTHIDNAQPLTERVKDRRNLDFAALRAILFPPQPAAATPNRRQMVASYRQRLQEGNIANYAEGYLDGVRDKQQRCQEPPDAMTIKIKHDYRVVHDGAATYPDGFRDGYAYATEPPKP